MFNARSIYPNAVGISTLDQSIPDGEEQRAVTQVDDTAPMIVTNKNSMWLWLGAFAVIAIVLSAGGKI